MMTSPNNTQLIDNYLSGNMSFAEKILFEARVAVNPSLKRDLHFQKKTYRLVKMYHREQLKGELKMVHQELFQNPDKLDFQQSIRQLFN